MFNGDLFRTVVRAGGNPDLRLSEIFNDYRSVGFAHENGEEKESRLKFSV